MFISKLICKGLNKLKTRLEKGYLNFIWHLLYAILTGSIRLIICLAEVVGVLEWQHF